MTRCKKNAFVAGLLGVLAAGTTLTQAAPGFARLPLYFAQERASDGSTQFLARGSANEVLISGDGVQITLPNEQSIHMGFQGASFQSHIQGAAPLAGKINYLTGNDAQKWRTGISTFSQVQVHALYPGIDAVYYGNDQQLEYDFTIAPGSTPEAIRLHFSGSASLSLNAAGDLALESGNVLLHKPVVYQLVAGTRREIAGAYNMGGDRTIGFSLGAYDHSLPLVIDPLLTYSSYLGGNAAEAATSLALYTNDGSIFMAGQTLASHLATTNGVFQSINHGGTSVGDAFVAKFTPSGTNMNLAFLTYVGGSGDDCATSIAVNKNGNAFIGGFTDSPDFPVANHLAGLPNQISGAINRAGTYFLDGFVAELATNGSSLIYSTYLGGSSEDSVNALAIDSADNAYVTGYTLSTNLPVRNAVPFTLLNTTSNLLNYLPCTNTFFNCSTFIAKISPLGTNLDYLTYFGGNNYDLATGIAVDGAAHVYVTGYTDSTNFPNTNSFQKYLNSGLNVSNSVNYIFDAYVAKFSSVGTNLTLLYSTFLGNTNTDQASAIAVDGDGSAYVTGFTTSTNFPNTTINSFSNTNGQVTNVIYPVIVNRLTNNINGIVYSTNVFLTKIVTANKSNPNQASIGYSVVFGGTRNDVGYGVALDPVGNVFVTGTANSSDFPTNNTTGFLQPQQLGFSDVFVTGFNTNCTQVLYSAYLGGIRYDVAYGIAVDSQSTVYIAGQTYSPDFPFSTNVENLPIINGRVSSLNASYDAFLAMITLTNISSELNITKSKTNSVTLSWRSYLTPEIGPFTLVSSHNLNSNIWAATATPAKLGYTNGGAITYTNFLTLPDTGSNQFFRLSQ